MIYEEISENRQPNDTNVFTKPNEAYQTSGTVMIESKENEAYGAAVAEVFIKPNEAYQFPGSAAVTESKEYYEAYGANTEMLTKPNEAYHIPDSVAMIESKKNEAYGALITSVEL